MRRVIALSFSSLLYLTPCFADYRVYQYIVTSNLPNKGTQSNLLNSSLNPVAFKEYYGQIPSDEIHLLRTWICKGDTSKKVLCLPPEMK